MIKNHFILTRPNSSSAMKSCPRTLTPSASTLTSSNILKMDILRGFYHDVVTRLSLFFFLWETVLDIEIFSFKICTCMHKVPQTSLLRLRFTQEPKSFRRTSKKYKNNWWKIVCIRIQLIQRHFIFIFEFFRHYSLF